MRRNIVGFFFVCLVSFQASSLHAQDAIRDLVVKIHAVHHTPDLLRPWARNSPQQVKGSGVVIDGKRILTNAHVVRYASQIYVQPNQSADLISARVEAMTPSMDLAVLKLDDESFFDKRGTLSFADELPRVKDSVNVYGYPTGGTELSVTQGIVSRIEYTDYYYQASGLRIQVDAALNFGNSGGPAVSNGKLVGLVFSLIQNAQNIGYLIPVEEIRLFLADIADREPGAAVVGGDRAEPKCGIRGFCGRERSTGSWWRSLTAKTRITRSKSGTSSPKLAARRLIAMEKSLSATTCGFQQPTWYKNSPRTESFH